MTGHANRIDRTHPASVRSRYAIHVSLYVQTEPSDLNGNFARQWLSCDRTKHREDDWTLLRLSPIDSRELPKPLFCDRTCLLLYDQT